MASNEAPTASNVQVEMNIAVPSTPNTKRTPWPQAEEQQFLVMCAENAISAHIASKVGCTFKNTFRIKVSFVAQPTTSFSGRIQKYPKGFQTFPNDIQICHVNFRYFQMIIRNVQRDFRPFQIYSDLSCEFQIFPNDNQKYPKGFQTFPNDIQIFLAEWDYCSEK